MIPVYLALIFYMQALSAMQQIKPKVVIKRPIIIEPQIRAYKNFSLKQMCFAYGVKMFGKDFMDQFSKQSTGTKLVNLQDLKEDADHYYQLCLREITECAGTAFPRVTTKDGPPAQPIKKVIEQARAKSRFDLIEIVKAHFNKLRWPAITLLAGAGYTNAVIILLDHGDDVGARDFTGKTPLICSAKNGRVTTTKLLLEYGADLHPKDACKCDALCHADKNKHKNITWLIKEKHEKNLMLREDRNVR